MRDHRSTTHPLNDFYRWGIAQGGEVAQATERWAHARAQAGSHFDPRRVPNPAPEVYHVGGYTVRNTDALTEAELEALAGALYGEVARLGCSAGGPLEEATRSWARARFANPASQRVWKRVEAPGTPQGHLLEADLGGFVWQAYQQADGQWVVTGGGYQAPLYFREWADVRAFVEGGAATAPQPNPLDPLTAAAAATGAAIAMRSHLVNNPAEPHDLAYDQGRRDAMNFAPSRAASLTGGVKQRYKQGFADGLRDRK